MINRKIYHGLNSYICTTHTLYKLLMLRTWLLQIEVSVVSIHKIIGSPVLNDFGNAVRCCFIA